MFGKIIIKIKQMGIRAFLRNLNVIFLLQYRKYFCRGKIKSYKNIAQYFRQKNGLEIGGPSKIFSVKGKLPIYNIMQSCDGVNFSAENLWFAEKSKDFKIDGQRVGELFIADGTDLTVLPDKKYDFILSCNNLEHIANPLKAIEQWLYKLKENGVLILVLPRKKVNFDHRREITKFEHLLTD